MSLPKPVRKVLLTLYNTDPAATVVVARASGSNSILCFLAKVCKFEMKHHLSSTRRTKHQEIQVYFFVLV